MQISFYVLGERFQHSSARSEGNPNESTLPSDDIIDQPLSDMPSKDVTTSFTIASNAVIHFICRLTQTVLRKSTHSLVIIDDNSERLAQIDTQLWTFEPTSFIPHGIMTTPQAEAIVDTVFDPVTLMHTQPLNFDGVVLNLASNALPLKKAATLPDRVLEIITPDKVGLQQGREKYKYYQKLGFELIYHPIN